MNDKELYRQKHQAQLDEWKAEVARLKAKAAGVKADAQIELNRHVKELEHRMRDAGAKLAELATASEERWASMVSRTSRSFSSSFASSSSI